MQESAKIWLEIQPLPGVKSEQRIKELEGTMREIISEHEEILSKIGESDEIDFKIERDKTFVTEGLVVGVTIWFFGKITEKIFDEYIWPKLKEKIDGIFRK